MSALLVVAAACSAQPVGQLTPMPAAGVTVSARHAPADTAELRAGELTVRVGGTWATRDASAIDATFANAGAAPVSIDPAQFGLALAGEAAVLDSVDDVTGVDVSEPGNKSTPQPLFGGATIGRPLLVPAGGERKVLVRFRNWRRDGNRATKGKTLVATVPLGSESRPITFRCDN